MDIRSQIMVVAQDLIQRNGVDSFSFRTLADEVNIKSASVHYHFPKKEDLIAEIAKKYNEEFFSALNKIKESKASSKKKVMGLLSLFEGTKRDNKVCLCAMLASTSGRLDQGSNSELNHFFTKLSEWMTDILVTANQNNELSSAISIKSLSNLIIASFEGALLIDRVDDNYKYLKSCKDLINDVLK